MQQIDVNPARHCRPRTAFDGLGVLGSGLREGAVARPK